MHRMLGDDVLAAYPANRFLPVKDHQPVDIDLWSYGQKYPDLQERITLADVQNRPLEYVRHYVTYRLFQF